MKLRFLPAVPLLLSFLAPGKPVPTAETAN